MNISPILVFTAGILTRVYSNAVPVGGDRYVCPPTENIAPCTCLIPPSTNRVTALCSNFTDPEDLQDIFDRNAGWNIQDVQIVNSVLSYLPADMFEKAYFQSLNISSTTLVTLFDRIPKTTPEMNVYLENVQVLRSFSWSSIANANLLEIITDNVKVKSFGLDFKDNFPKGAIRMWFKNTGVSSIKNEAFSVFTKLKLLRLTGGNLKKLSRDMFPNPWDVDFLDLSYHKIAALPEDFFTGMPKISSFVFQGNMLTTLPEKLFLKLDAYYYFEGNPINCDCSIKWIFGKIQPWHFNGECHEPTSRNGTQFVDLKAEYFDYCK